MKEKTATFIGHKDCFFLKEEIVVENIRNLLEEGYRYFLCGGMGRFDELCAGCVFRLKKDFPDIKSFLIIPYLNFHIQNPHYYDEVVYPDGFEQYYFKEAILKRNRYLVENSSAAICYIEHAWGGAAKTYQFAVRKCLKTILL